MKPIVCPFCENTIYLKQVQRHEDMCGARTKPCTICQKLVTFKDFSNHEANCVRRNDQRREERSQTSQDHYISNRRNVRGQRPRQNSTTNGRQQANRSNSIHQKIHKPLKMKPSNMIGPETIKPVIDPVPISVRMALKQKDQRVPLKSKN